DLLEQLAVNELRGHVDLGDVFFAEDDAAVIALAGADTADAGETAVLPLAGDDVGILLMRAGDALAAAAHHGVENLDGVDAVMEESWIALVQVSGAVSQSADDLAVLPLHELHQLGRVAERRATEDRHLLLGGQLDHFLGVRGAAGERLIDVAGNAGLEERLGPLQVDAALLRLNQH